MNMTHVYIRNGTLDLEDQNPGSCSFFDCNTN